MRLVGLSVLVAVTTLSPASAQKTPSNSVDVTVTGIRPRDADLALKECIARKCPPKEDIAASMEQAKNLFIAGDYRAARSVLLASRGRNFRYRAEYPEPISNLVLANAMVAAHLGESRTARLETIVSLDVLKRAFAANDPRVLKARLELAYQRLRSSDLDEAITQFRAVEELATDQPEILGTALLAQVMIAEKLARSSKINYAWVGEGANYIWVGDRAKKALLGTHDPALAPYVATLRILEATKAAERGDYRPLDAALKVYRQYAVATKRPLLIFRPGIDLSFLGSSSADPTALLTGNSKFNPSLAPDAGLLTQTQSQFEDQWVDVGFLINPDGSVGTPTVLRGSGTGERPWIGPVLKAIAGRRYAPYDAASRQFAPFRIERFTYTADFGGATHSRVRLHIGTPKVESIDLTGTSPETGR